MTHITKRSLISIEPSNTVVLKVGIGTPWGGRGTTFINQINFIKLLKLPYFIYILQKIKNSMQLLH